MKEDFSKIAAQGLYAFVADIYKKAYNQGDLEYQYKAEVFYEYGLFLPVRCQCLE